MNGCEVSSRPYFGLNAIDCHAELLSRRLGLEGFWRTACSSVGQSAARVGVAADTAAVVLDQTNIPLAVMPQLQMPRAKMNDFLLDTARTVLDGLADRWLGVSREPPTVCPSIGFCADQ